MSNSPEIIVRGDSIDARKDLYCHRFLGGCGTVFRANIPKSEYMGDGDYSQPTVTCPNCHQSLRIELKSNTGWSPASLVYHPRNN